MKANSYVCTLNPNTAKMSGNDIKIELEKSDHATLYVVVSSFKNNIYIHIRKYYNNQPSKFGVCFLIKEWYEFIVFFKHKVDDGRKTMERVDVRRMKTGALQLTYLRNESTVYMKKSAVEALITRYVSII